MRYVHVCTDSLVTFFQCDDFLCKCRRQRKIEKRMYKNMRRAERYARKQERREAIFSLIVGLFTGDNKPPQKAQMVERVQSAEGSLGTMAQQPRRLQAPVVASEKTLNPANATSITSTSTSACDSNNAAVIQPKLPSYNEAIST